MKNIMITTAGLALAAGMAQAGGIERSTSPYAILWEKGNYAELSFGHVSPDVSGTFMGVGSGDMSGNYNQFGLAVKYALNDSLDLALVFDQPIGADVAYPLGTGYFLAGNEGTVESSAITALARYKLGNGFSVHGGLKVQRTSGEVNLVAPAAYTMTTSKETDLGYIIGAAYERPDIALRVALTYQSAITHDFDSVEMGFVPGKFSTEVPQSLTLDFQSGVAADTLVFGSVRWREWSAFDISPPNYPSNPLVGYKSDTTTYTLGVGYRFNDNFSAAISVGYEDGDGKLAGNLGPHDGMKSITLGGTYTKDNMKITAGVSYIDIGDATTETINAKFTGNSGVGIGMKVGYSF